MPKHDRHDEHDTAFDEEPPVGMQIERHRLVVVEQLLRIRHGINSTFAAWTPNAVLADLDDDQRRAVTTESRLVAVIAGAGSGKTRVLTRRIAYRIATGRPMPATPWC